MNYLGSNIIKYVIILTAVAFFFFPIWWMFITSMKPQLEVMYYPPKFLPPEITFKYYFDALHWEAGHSMRNSFIITSVTTVVATILGSMAGYSFARYKIGGFHLPFWVLSIRMMPPVAAIIPLFMIMLKLRLIDTHLAIIITHLLVTLPFAVWMMRGFFIEMPVEIEEAATIDGCSKWQILWRIAFPLTAPGIAVTALFCFIFSWNEFVFALVLSRKDAITLPVIIAGTRTQFGIHWSVMTAMSAMACLPVFAIALVAQKYLVRGLTLGAIK